MTQPLTPIEPIVLDREGNPIAGPQSRQSGTRADPMFGHVKVLRGGWPLAVALLVGIPLVLFFGAAIFAIVIGLMLVFSVLRFVVRAFR